MHDPAVHSESHYALLGLPATASFAEVKAAYRHLARRYHPDLNPNNPIAEAHLKALNGAYAQLCDRYNNPRPQPAKTPAAPQRVTHSDNPNYNQFYEIFTYAVAGNYQPRYSPYQKQDRS